MHFLPGKSTLGIFLAVTFIGLGSATASTINFTNRGNSSNLGSSITDTVDGTNITVSAFEFSDSNSEPSSSGANTSFITSAGNSGIGIGPGSNPQNTAENDGGREFFLVEFDQSVSLNSASISEFGNDNGSTLGGDSDVNYWVGTGAFDFDNLGTRFEDGILSDVLADGETRNINFNSGLGSINWLLLGPEAFDSGIATLAANDYITLRNIEFEIAAVPLPASIWLMGTALISLSGLNRKSAKSTSS
ncbi:MAG: VPLPA-CTERM sorting domain-containing protein [Methylococcales bacterium]